ncbi:hypothetical protein VNO80_08650 [Phaseolus coccineus]|uniref:AMP-binding enzyme C-terminal domain-containing protein n=1 Tax=Phaseolus coccineus TaxID=3886 RepID=A0AAN9N4V8_PHACN
MWRDERSMKLVSTRDLMEWTLSRQCCPDFSIFVYSLRHGLQKRNLVIFSLSQSTYARGGAFVYKPSSKGNILWVLEYGQLVGQNCDEWISGVEGTQDLKGGWFMSSDLGVKHPDGYIELKDRSKDTINYGRENTSTIELEAVFFSHPAVYEAAVVGRPDNYLGGTACAF